MQVKQLMFLLSTMPPDAEVKHLWDGRPRSAIEYVWLSRGGDVITAGHHEMCREESARPEFAPSVRADEYWGTPEVDG